MSNLCINICIEACTEFQAQGFKKDVDPRSLKESYNIEKRPDGQWFKSTKPSLHEAAVLTLLDLSLMPALKQLTNKIDSLDDEIKEDGGRIFISEYLVYKIKKGTQTPLLVYENTEKVDGRFRKLCDEMIEHGLERDRYRTEETYMLTKTAGNEWSMTTSHENHSGTKIILDLKKMPQLKLVASKLSKADPKFQTNGGRVFITPKRIYRLNNKIEVVLKI
jgi:hypothetical protein